MDLLKCYFLLLYNFARIVLTKGFIIIHDNAECRCTINRLPSIKKQYDK